MKVNPIYQIKEPYEGWRDVPDMIAFKRAGFGNTKRIVFSAEDVRLLQRENDQLLRHLKALVKILDGYGFETEEPELAAALQRAENES